MRFIDLRKFGFQRVWDRAIFELIYVIFSSILFIFVSPCNRPEKKKNKYLPTAVQMRKVSKVLGEHYFWRSLQLWLGTIHKIRPLYENLYEQKWRNQKIFMIKNPPNNPYRACVRVITQIFIGKIIHFLHFCPYKLS